MVALVPHHVYYKLEKKNNPYHESKKGLPSPKIKKEENDDPENNSSIDESEEKETEDTTETVIPGFVDSDIIAERDILKKRLRQKLNTLRAQRNAPPLTEDEFIPGKISKRSKDLNKDIKKLGKKDKKDLKKLGKQEKKMKKGKYQPRTLDSILLQNKSQSSLKSQNTSQKSTTDDTTIEYATFDFSSGEPVPTYLQNKKRPSKSQLLKQVQDKKVQQQELQGTEQGDALVKKEAWDTMKKRAQGEKVLNDADKLKKSIKRGQQLKKKRKKEWNQRISKTKKSQVMAQKKRTDNIAAAKERKFGGKRKKSFSNNQPPNKKQRVGFEGTRKQIINKE